MLKLITIFAILTCVLATNPFFNLIDKTEQAKIQLFGQDDKCSGSVKELACDGQCIHVSSFKSFKVSFFDIFLQIIPQIFQILNNDVIITNYLTDECRYQPVKEIALKNECLPLPEKNKIKSITCKNY